MEQSKHTPTPWAVGNNGTAARGHAICADSRVIGEVYGTGYPIGKGWSPSSAADAALIVRAVNAHAALVEALRQAAAALAVIGNQYSDRTETDSELKLLRPLQHHARTEFQRARAALALVGEE